MAASPEPRSGDDTYDLTGDAVTALAERRGAWPGDDITALALIASLIGQAGQWLPQHVHDARAGGHSWDEIARALATSPAEARLRFDPPSPLADGRWPCDF
jgi:hypothetical protein